MKRAANILILSEGGAKIGFGHITRCGALYEALEEKGAKPLFVINGDDSVKALLKGKNARICDWLKKRAEISDLMSRADVVVVDSYLAGLDFYQEVSRLARIPVYFDDNRRLNYPRGLVVNGSLYAKRLDYPRKEGVAYLLGADYAPLRKEFRDVPAKKIRNVVKNILITMGGNDFNQVTPKVLKFFTARYPLLKKTVIIGRGFKGIKEVELLEDGNTRILYHPGVGKIMELMLEADIAVTAGGQTLYELARIGLPSIAIAVAENQFNNVRWWFKTGFLGAACRYDSGRLDSTLSKGMSRLISYRSRLYAGRSGASYVDGKGAVRIAGAIMSLLYGRGLYKDKPAQAKRISLRRADRNDCLDLLRWRNHPEVRSRSFSKREIGYPEHRRWFTKKIRDRSSRIYIAEVGSLGKIGQIRFDMGKDRSATVSVNMNPAFLGMGLGGKVIEKGTRLFLKEARSIDTVLANILDKNRASVRAFQKADYVFSGNASNNGRKCLVYKFGD